MSITEQAVQEEVIKETQAEAKSNLLGEYMKKTSDKMKLAKSIDQLQEQLEALTKQKVSLDKELSISSKALDTIKADVTRQESVLRNIDNFIKDKHKDAVQELSDMKKTLAKNVDEYNSLIIKAENMRQEANNRDADLKQREHQFELRQSEVKKGYDATEQTLQSQLNHIQKEQQNSSKRVDEAKIAESKAEIKINESKAELLKLDKRKNELDRFDTELKELKETLESKHAEAMRKLEDAVAENALMRDSLSREKEEVSKQKESLNKRELELRSYEKKIKDMIKVNNLESQLKEE